MQIEAVISAPIKHQYCITMHANEQLVNGEYVYLNLKRCSELFMFVKV